MCLLFLIYLFIKSSEIHEVAVQIGELVAKAENLGNEGNIDESLAMLKDAEEIKVLAFKVLGVRICMYCSTETGHSFKNII